MTLIDSALPSKRQKNEYGTNPGQGESYSSNEEPRRKRHDVYKPNHILLFTIINPMYPITVDILHKICESSGQVLRIVIFKKNGVQAMVEFDSIESATRAKESLNGADIYTGCCTLKIEFAKQEKLNVHRNDAESWDYTVASMSGEIPPIPSGKPALLPEPQYAAIRPHPYPPYPTDPMSASVSVVGDYRDHTMPHTQHAGAVLMVYGLDPINTNADKLFNLFCLYGNVVRITFLKSKEGTAMIQMGDSLAADRCIQNLNNVTLDFRATPVVNSQESPSEYKLRLAFSKQPYLNEVTNPYPLPDKTPSYKEFINNKNNRFTNPATTSKNRIQPPSKILHFFNTPPHLADGELIQVFKSYGVAAPKAVRLFPMKSDKSSSGLLEFDTVNDAVVAIMNCNHAAIESTDAKYPFIMKLCFSSSRSLNFSFGDTSTSSGDIHMME